MVALLTVPVDPVTSLIEPLKPQSLMLLPLGLFKSPKSPVELKYAYIAGTGPPPPLQAVFDPPITAV